MAVQVLTLNTQINSENTLEVPEIKLQDAKDTSAHMKLGTDFNYKHEIVVKLVVIFSLLHLGAVYGLYLIFSHNAMILTAVWSLIAALGSSQGIILGAHRGWSHNAFRMTTLGKIILILLQTSSGQNHVYWWARDHRLHHKFCDTDADPYNASRGFFFSHIGWLLMRKHPMVAEKGKTIDMSDLKACKLIMFQKKYFVPLFAVFCVILPILIPVYFWKETLWNSFFVAFVFRYVLTLNCTWCINSIAHLYGTREFDKRITARQSYFANLFSFGEGWHNYHHSFPNDHAMSEFGYNGGFSTNCLYFMYNLGLIYDLKRTSRQVVSGHFRRHGDGTIGTESSTFSGPEYFE